MGFNEQRSNKSTKIMLIILVITVIATAIVLYVAKVVRDKSLEHIGGDAADHSGQITMPPEEVIDPTVDVTEGNTPEKEIPAGNISGTDLKEYLVNAEKESVTFVYAPQYSNTESLQYAENSDVLAVLVSHNTGEAITIDDHSVSFRVYGKLPDNNCIFVTDNGSYIFEGGFKEEIKVMGYMIDEEGNRSEEMEEVILNRGYSMYSEENDCINYDSAYEPRDLINAKGQLVGKIYIPSDVHNSVIELIKTTDSAEQGE